MKKLLFQTVLCLLFVTTSCSTEDDDPGSKNGVTVTKELLVGKWYFVDQVVNGTRIPYDDHEECGKDYIEFKEDGTLWQMDIWNCDEDLEQTGVYSISDELTINGESIHVVALNSSTFSIKGEEDVDEDGELDEVILNFDR